MQDKENALSSAPDTQPDAERHVRGEFVDLAGERYYAIRNVDGMPPFFISVLSNVDHWLFVSSTGGLTAGRGSPDTALFPYITVDKIHESTPHTGPRTLFRVQSGGLSHCWEPFNREHDGRYATSRHLYKHTLGNKLCFQEINHDLGLDFRYTWVTSDRYGFVRRCELHNTGTIPLAVEVLDGLQNVLPAGTPRFTQTNSSNLVDAYKWTELDESLGLGVFTLYSGITDRAAPCESLKANVVYALNLDAPRCLISSAQLAAFRRGQPLQPEPRRRGIRGAFFVNTTLELAPGVTRDWQLVADIELGQNEVVALRHELTDPARLATDIASTVRHGTEDLARIMASSDGLQVTAEENVSVHHLANVSFNVLRGGYFPRQYLITRTDLVATIKAFNQPAYARNQACLDALPPTLPFTDLMTMAESQDDPQLLRLCREYLPIGFGRRHGDPSRPWNQFNIRVKDPDGEPVLFYEGNWRDIFQNWEALACSFPEFVESMIAKFVNASTVDGYNPYRITKEGIDWEVEDPEDPWSYIGYWGDHQIIYLLKLLELSAQYHPQHLAQLLHERIFAYANVPYRIAPFDALLADPKSTVTYDDAVSERIDGLLQTLGADGKLVLDRHGEVYLVNLLEKLLVPLLSKLGNLVVEGGIWLNTQRPEWNDANNALVGQGLSMVTLYYLRRYLRFLRNLLDGETREVALSTEVATWLAGSTEALREFRPVIASGQISAEQRYSLLERLGRAASEHRETMYRIGAPSGFQSVSPAYILALLDEALPVVDHSIRANRRPDGMYHAYNLMDLRQRAIDVDTLYPMLEGQVAVLSAGAMPATEAISVVEALFASEVYRPDQHTFMLYPDRELPAFLEKNRIPEDKFAAIPLLQRLLGEGNRQIVLRDKDGTHRFSADFTNVDDLDAALDSLAPTYGEDTINTARPALRELFQDVFNHQAFTGRSGTMFGFEGLGCVYWHMVSKLLLAVQETYFQALDRGEDPATVKRLGALYYRVRAGIGFNKSPADYGAFPTDPYSHTPGHSGARQPGMTGQAKEEVLTRFGELGLRVRQGIAHFAPTLLRRQEFVESPRTACLLDQSSNWQEVAVPARGLAFTWCQVPIIYELVDGAAPAVTVHYADGQLQSMGELNLSAEDSATLFRREGRLRRIHVTFGPDTLFAP
jgi:hypothetical protein